MGSSIDSQRPFRKGRRRHPMLRISSSSAASVSCRRKPNKVTAIRAISDRLPQYLRCGLDGLEHALVTGDHDRQCALFGPYVTATEGRVEAPGSLLGQSVRYPDRNGGCDGAHIHVSWSGTTSGPWYNVGATRALGLRLRVVVDAESRQASLHPIDTRISKGTTVEPVGVSRYRQVRRCGEHRLR